MNEHVGIKGDLSFEEWIVHVFDHDDSNWHWELDAPYWNPNVDPARALEFLARLFSEPGILISRYSPAQIGTGLTFLASSSCSDYGFVFFEPSLPVERRVEGLLAIGTLYEKLLSRVCLNSTPSMRTGVLDTTTAADDLCFMFWDEFPMHPRSKSDLSASEFAADPEAHLRLEAACLEAMERTLALDQLACQEGALHGLGHWADGYPKRVRAAIDAYLKRPDVPRPLREYAKAARTGNVP